MDIDQIQQSWTTFGIGAAVVVVLIIALIVFLSGIKVAKPDEAIIVTSRQKRLSQDPDGEGNAGQRVVFGSASSLSRFSRRTSSSACAAASSTFRPPRRRVTPSPSR